MLQLNPSRLSPTEATHKDFLAIAQNIYIYICHGITAHALRGAPPLPPFRRGGGQDNITHQRGRGHRSGLITITAFKVTSTALYLGLLWFALHSIFHCRRLFFGPCEVGMREGGNPKSLGGHARKGGDCAQPTLELTGKSRNTSSLPCYLLSK